ncbi:MAG: hypothetical protein KJ064_28065 [Anaerolineae bacterium]|nr:hypothetical protein [Anaerolineae bacterium]
MSKLRVIYQLLREEYAISRHLWWVDAESGKLVNDVTYCLISFVKLPSVSGMAEKIAGVR